MSALPAEPQQLSCSVEELQSLFLFEKLSEDQLQWLCERGHVELIEPGTVYAEGAPATCFYVLLEGTVVLSRRVGADDIEADASQAGELGATTLVPPTDIGVGQVAVLQDPQGAVFALYAGRFDD